MAVWFLGSHPLSAQWLQWGGPNRDFTTNTTGLAPAWPEDGPRRLWQRPLGDGYSSIVADDRRLYTMYRRGEDEIVVALSPDSGETLWAYRYSAVIDTGDHPKRYGLGPRSTPLVVGDRLYTIGFNGKMHCLNGASGNVLWSVDLLVSVR